MIMILDFLGFTWRSLDRQRRRVLPGLFGVAAAVAILLAVLAGTDWISTVTNRDILGQRSLSQMTVTAGAAPTFTNADVQWMVSLKGVQGGYPLLMGAFPAAIGTEGSIFQIGNLPNEVDRPALLTGTWPQENQVVVPDVGMASKRNGAPIDGQSLLGKTVTLTVPISHGLEAPKFWTVTVVGVYHRDTQGIERTVYAPLTTLQSILVAQGTFVVSSSPLDSAGFGTYILDADAPSYVAGIASQLQARGFRTQYAEQGVHGLSKRIQSIQAGAAILVTLIMGFAALSISNTLIQAGLQRRREIAILLAVGFSPAWVGAAVVAESALIGLVGIVIGVAAAEIVVAAVGRVQPSLDFRITVGAVVLVGFGALLFCLGAAWLPTRRAMQVDPIAVLREE